MKPMTYTKASALINDTKTWILKGEDIFIPQYLLTRGLPNSTFDDIRNKYPELAPRIAEVNAMDEAKIISFMTKGKIPKSVGEFILNRYYPAKRGTNEGSGVVVHLEY